jgi:hypothetical protein
VNLKNRLKALEDVLPPPRRTAGGKPVPTESLAAFIKGLYAGDFDLRDVDQTDYAQSQLFNEFGAGVLVSLSPDHQAWCDAAPWGRKAQDEWERANLSTLTPEEMAWLREFAARWFPPRERGGDATTCSSTP